MGEKSREEIADIIRLNMGEDGVISLHTEYNRKTKVLMWTGFIILMLTSLSVALIPSLINSVDDTPIIYNIIYFVFVIIFLGGGFYLFMNGCMSYAKLKGYRRWWGLLGLFSFPLGILVLLLLPDRPDKYEVFLKDIVSDETLKQWEEDHHVY
jgi:hypothetical protein